MAEQISSDAGGTAIRFDHIGLAVAHPTDLWLVMAGVLGGRFAGSGSDEGYGWTQLRFANGFVLEALHPDERLEDDAGRSDDPEVPPGAMFLHRFLAEHGPGPHHLTFDVDDLDLARQHLLDAGYEPVLDRDDGPQWREVVLHPADAHGIVVQLVQRTLEAPPEELPEGFPEQDYSHPVASLGRVVHAVADLDAALGLYRDTLGGREVSSGSAIDGNHWVELGWDGPGRLRLLEATHGELVDWLGDRTGRLRHLYFSFDEPALVPGATKVAQGRWVVGRDEWTGTRLVLTSSAR